jgi:hypothetical protein
VAEIGASSLPLRGDTGKLASPSGRVCNSRSPRMNKRRSSAARSLALRAGLRSLGRRPYPGLTAWLLDWPLIGNPAPFSPTTCYNFLRKAVTGNYLDTSLKRIALPSLRKCENQSTLLDPSTPAILFGDGHE